MGKNITFIGADNGVGTTMIAQAVAEVLSDNDNKVLFLSASGHSGTEYIGKESIGLDDIKNSLVNDILKLSDLRELITAEKVDFIKGTENPLYYRHYMPQHVKTITELLTDDYDYIIIDGGSDPQQGLHIGAITVSEDVYLVTTQHVKSLERYKHKEQDVYGEMHLSPKIVLNKFLKSAAYFDKANIEKLYGESVVAVVPYSEYGMQAEINKASLNTERNFENSIKVIAGDITGEVREAKKGFFKK